MKLSEVNYGHFVVWSESELVVLRVRFDEDFIATASKRATYFKYGILRILGKWYTKPPAPKAPVPVTMMMVILLRNVDAIVGEKMKEK